MKRIMFGAVLAFALVSCGGEAEETETPTEAPVDKEAVMELENATEEVTNGLDQLEESVQNLNSEVDSLLEGF